MTKKLVVRFIKLERALVAQQLEVKGQFELSKHIALTKYGVDFAREAVYISPETTREMNAIGREYFNSNDERDEYLEKVIKWISEEQFPTKGNLEIGKVCEVSSNKVDWDCRIFAGKTAKQLGEPRYIAFGVSGNYLVRWKYVRPIDSCAQPKIDGDIYTWEMEVAQ